MKKKKIFLFALAVGLTVALISPGSSNLGIMDQLKTSAFEEFEIFGGAEDTNGTETNGTETNSTIEEKFYEKTEEFYELIERLFVLYSDSNSTSGDTNATTYTFGDYEFYFGETEDGYCFGDVNGTMYFIQDINGTLPNSADTHLSNLFPTFDKILKALGDGKIGRAFGLMNSCEARMKATEKHLCKVEERSVRKEEKELELQIRKEERERKKEEAKEKGKDKDDKSKGKEDDKGKDKDKDNKGKGKGKPKVW
ncbi:MAG: hypothetical protein KAV80_06325 [Methanomicrobia archaeon]|nr:hypothetical protein [Methanomicrobia archaeon]